MICCRGIMENKARKGKGMITAILNQKGGVGKSTTAAAIAAGLRLEGKTTLLIDLDAQRNLTYTTGAKESPAILETLLNGADIRDAIQDTQQGAVIAGCKGLSGADAYLTQTGKEYRLKEALKGLIFDEIIIDTPPALGILTINALTAADRAIIPAQADVFSIQGIAQLKDTITAVKKYTNPGLIVSGILLTRYNARATLTRKIDEMAQQLAGTLQTRVYNTRIRENISVKEAQMLQKDIFTYAPRSKAAEDYKALIEELKGEGK